MIDEENGFIALTPAFGQALSKWLKISIIMPSNQSKKKF